MRRVDANALVYAHRADLPEYDTRRTLIEPGSEPK